MAVWVQVPLAVLKEQERMPASYTCEAFSFGLLQVVRRTYVESPTRCYYISKNRLDKSGFSIIFAENLGEF